MSAGAHLVLGTLLFTLGVSLYLKTRMGVAPIDAIAPVIVGARTRLSYTPVRMAQDILVTVVAVLAGGPIGVFTVVAAFMTGPLIDGVEPRGHASALPPLPRAGPGRAGRGARLARREERRRAMQRARAERRLFVGTYTEDTASEGIYVLAFDEDERRLHVVNAGTHAPNPSYLVRAQSAGSPAGAEAGTGSEARRKRDKHPVRSP